jgi:hypothetical protein
MIDFSKFAAARNVQVPVIGNKFSFEKKKYSINATDGWYTVKLDGNSASVVEPLYMFNEVESKYDVVKGYSYNNSLIFHNFDVAKRKWSFQLSKELHFNKSQSFTAIKAVVWENNEVYFTESDYSNFKIFEIKAAYDEDKNLDHLKGVTQELRTVFLFHTLEREQLRAMELLRLEELAEDERRKREAELMATVQGRLQVMFSRAGARVTKYNISGTRITVDWEMDGRKFNSVIDSITFKVIEAGYCMSGEDTNHNITSLVKLAEDYEEQGLIHITRH